MVGGFVGTESNFTLMIIAIFLNEKYAEFLDYLELLVGCFNFRATFFGLLDQANKMHGVREILHFKIS